MAKAKQMECISKISCFLILLLVTFGVARVATKPNIILLFADDLGYGDLSVYGHPTSSTPNLDKMASQGLLFTQFYSASPLCSPSRAALLTGRYQTRSGVYPAVFASGSVGGLPLNETTIAEGLKDEGYTTSIVGKWHLGVGKDNEYLPTRQGFDSYLGIPYSQDMCPCVHKVCFYPNVPCIDKACENGNVPCPLFQNENIVQQPADFLELMQNYLKGAESFIKTSADKKTPFFLYLAFQHMHAPQFAGKMFTNSSIRGQFGDALNEMDWAVGQIFQYIEEAGVKDNTFVFFTADNGPSLAREIYGGNAGPLRCGKYSTWEGGHREPAIAWWPGKIKPGRTMEVAATVDVFPTLMNIVGGKIPANVTMDGVDMAPILFNDGKSNRDFFIFYPGDPNKTLGIFAIRWKEYKAHYYSHGGLCTTTHPDVVCRSNYTLHAYDPPLLYNLHNDPGEIYELNVKEYSDVMKQIETLKKSFEADMVWGESQMGRGQSPELEPCARPGCTPFPSCCTTSSFLQQDMSLALI
ncbi:arylsulfatase A-like [Halichondria panicea]|uniref:arylsulfatase A-like n=1 Tax=Halichondria panicea TaxID=6063 RepID=UPI00312BB71F